MRRVNIAALARGCGQTVAVSFGSGPKTVTAGPALPALKVATSTIPIVERDPNGDTAH